MLICATNPFTVHLLWHASTFKFLSVEHCSNTHHPLRGEIIPFACEPFNRHEVPSRYLPKASKKYNVTTLLGSRSPPTGSKWILICIRNTTSHTEFFTENLAVNLLDYTTNNRGFHKCTKLAIMTLMATLNSHIGAVFLFIWSRCS